MDGAKFIEKIGFFGILGLFFAFFLSFTLCTCLIVHVRYIWTYLCPLESVRNCFRSFCRKLSSSHKRVPQTLHELEELVSNTQSAKKLDREVNQAESLREFANITPRIGDFVVELRQQRVSRDLWSVEYQNPKVKVLKAKSGVRATSFWQDSEIISVTKKFAPHPDKEIAGGQIIPGSSQNFEGDISPKRCRSLNPRPAELVIEERPSEPCRSSVSQPKNFVFESDKTDLSHFSRCRSNSFSGRLNHIPFPRIKMTKRTSNVFDEY